jgi:lipoate-protein ligase A
LGEITLLPGVMNEESSCWSAEDTGAHPPLFSTLYYFEDAQPRDAGENMARDEALLQAVQNLPGRGGKVGTVRGLRVDVPILRWYRWAAPAVSVGYFQEGHPIRSRHPGRQFTRRRTGGGMVPHGPDPADGFTCTLVVPAAICRQTGLDNLRESYCRLHQRLRLALLAQGIPAQMVDCSPFDGQRPGLCFSEPVAGDVGLPGGAKIAGAAQARSRGSLLHQQIVQLPAEHRTDPKEHQEQQITGAFAQALARRVEPWSPPDPKSFDHTARALTTTRYNTPAWLEKR